MSFVNNVFISDNSNGNADSREQPAKDSAPADKRNTGFTSALPAWDILPPSLPLKRVKRKNISTATPY